jgi:hypothetical protein
MKKFIFIGLIVILMVSLTACAAKSPSLPAGAPNGTMPVMQTTVASTTEPATLEPTATAAPTNTPEPTATPVNVKLTVIHGIMCQAKPNYNSTRIGYLETGAVFTALGRDADTEYFYIENPTVKDGYCWVWTNYVLINGIAYDLPIVESK